MARTRTYPLKEYIKADRELKAKADAYDKRIMDKRSKLANRFIAANSPVKIGKVYHIVKGGIKRRGYDRFVVFQQQVQFMSNHPIIVVGGWWINKLTDKAEKWDSSSVVFGVGNPTIFKLAEDQKFISPDEE